MGHGPARYNLLVSTVAELEGFQASFNTSDRAYVAELDNDFTFNAQSTSPVNHTTVLNGPGGHGRWILGTTPHSVTDVSIDQQSAVANLYTFGAVGDGVADDSAAIAAMFANALATNRGTLKFPAGTFRVTTGFSLALDRINVDFGAARILVDTNADTAVFTFGLRSDTPINNDITIQGGVFELLNPANTANISYITVRGTKTVRLSKMRMLHVGDGGIVIEGGCEDVTIDKVSASGVSGYSTPRALWLNGSTVTDYQSEYVNLSSISPNNAAPPVFAVKKVKVTDCTFESAGYGVYLMNAWDVDISNCYFDVSGTGLRGVTVNTRSIRCRVHDNIFIGDQSSHGVMITEMSDAIVSGNEFYGDFGGGHDIAVQYLARALVTGNYFRTDTVAQVLVMMGATATFRDNVFTTSSGNYIAHYTCAKIVTIDPAAAPGTGDTATSLPGTVFAENTIYARLIGLTATSTTSTGGNTPSLDGSVVKNNVFNGYQNASGGDEYTVYTSSPVPNTITIVCTNNTVFPQNYGVRNTVSPGSTGANIVGLDVQTAIFNVSVAGGGAITISKFCGGYFGLSAIHSGSDLVLSPRTVGSTVLAAVASPISIVDLGGTIHSYSLVSSGTNYVLSVFGAGGAQINLSTTAASFQVVLSSTAT